MKAQTMPVGTARQSEVVTRLLAQVARQGFPLVRGNALHTPKQQQGGSRARS